MIAAIDLRERLALARPRASDELAVRFVVQARSSAAIWQ